MKVYSKGTILANKYSEKRSCVYWYQAILLSKESLFEWLLNCLDNLTFLLYNEHIAIVLTLISISNGRLVVGEIDKHKRIFYYCQFLNSIARLLSRYKTYHIGYQVKSSKRAVLKLDSNYLEIQWLIFFLGGLVGRRPESSETITNLSTSLNKLTLRESTNTLFSSTPNRPLIRPSQFATCENESQNEEPSYTNQSQLDADTLYESVDPEQNESLVVTRLNIQSEYQNLTHDSPKASVKLLRRSPRKNKGTAPIRYGFDD